MERCDECGGLKRHHKHCSQDPVNIAAREHDERMAAVAELEREPEQFIAPLPPAPEALFAIGSVVRHAGGVCMVVSEPDPNGTVGLSPIHERVRVNQDDVEEIE